MAVKPTAKKMSTMPATSLAPGIPMPPKVSAGGNEPKTTVSGAAAATTKKTMPTQPTLPRSPELVELGSTSSNAMIPPQAKCSLMLHQIT